MNHQTKIFFKELQKFIVKYHLIKLLQSSLIGLTIILAVYLLTILFNYLTYPTISIKKAIFIFFLIISTAVMLEFFLLKLIPLIFPKKRITYKQAATLIIMSNKDFDDRLLSIIDLTEKTDSDPLVTASITQKIKQLSFLSFSKIITVKQVIRSLQYLAFTIIFLLIIGFVNTDIIRTGTKKFIQYNKYFPRPAPFHFVLLNKNLTAKQDSNYTLHLMTKGSQIPKDVFIVIGNQQYLMTPDKRNTGIFYYTIHHPQSTIRFYFTALGYNSRFYTLQIKYLPTITSSKIIIYPPRYTGQKPRQLSNTTTLTVNQGSVIKFILHTRHTDKVIFITNKHKADTLKAKRQTTYTLLAGRDINLKIMLTNQADITSSLEIKIKTIPDLAPTISVSQTTDSTDLKTKYFHISISDDYGFSALKFFLKADSVDVSYSLPLSEATEQTISFGYNFDSITKIFGNVKYYFLVCDNKTPKPNCTRSQDYTFIKPGPQQLADKLDSLDSAIEKKSQTAKILSKQLEQLAQEYRQRLLTENLTEWEKKEAARQLQQKTDELKSLLEEIERLNQERNNLLNSFSEQSQHLQEKQQILDQLLKKVMNGDLHKLLEQLKQILEQNTSKTRSQDLQQLEQNYQMLNQKLEKTLEFFKKVALQQQLQEQSRALQSLAKKQDSLLNALKRKPNNAQKLKDEQEKLAKQLEQNRQQYRQAQEQNQSLNHPLPLKDMDQSFENIQKMMQENTQLLQQGKRQKSKHLQKQIIDSLDRLSKKMKQNLTTAQTQAQMLDLMEIYRLIAFLEQFSENVENIVNKTLKLNQSSQSLPVIESTIIEIRNQFIPLRDSLLSLSAQNIQLARIIDDKIYSISRELDKLPGFLEKRQKTSIINAEKNILANTNIILLVLTQVANSLENQMKNAMPSMQQKQGQGQQQAMMPLQQLQKQLQEQLQKLLEQAKKGQLNPKDLAQSLILKEKINFEIQKLLDQFANSLEVAQKLKEIQKINNQIARNLVDKQLDESVLHNAQLMKVKLWEAQNAMKKQNQYDKKRVAEHQQQIFYNAKMGKLKTENTKQIDYQKLIQLNTIKINPFYLDIYKSYRLNK